MKTEDEILASCTLGKCPLYKGDCLNSGRCLARKYRLTGSGWDFSKIKPPKSKPEPYKIPFDLEGNQLHYPDSRIEVAWEENSVFEDTLVYREYLRGRSAAYFVFNRQSDRAKVTVFMKDFEAMVPHMVQGFIQGAFTFCKRGQNYGCKLL